MAIDLDEGDWVPLLRKIRKSWIWQDPEVLRAWIDILMMANFDEGVFPFRGRLHPIKRGQVATTYLSLAQRNNWGRERARSLIEKLCAAQSITVAYRTFDPNAGGWLDAKSDVGFLLLTILNYPKKRSHSPPGTDPRMTQPPQGTDPKMSQKTDSGFPPKTGSTPKQLDPKTEEIDSRNTPASDSEKGTEKADTTTFTGSEAETPTAEIVENRQQTVSKQSANVPANSQQTSHIQEYKKDKKNKEGGEEGERGRRDKHVHGSVPRGRSRRPRGGHGDTEAKALNETVQAFHAYKTPKLGTKREHVADLLRQGVTHQRIRETAKANGRSDFFAVVKYLRNGKVDPPFIPTPKGSKKNSPTKAQLQDRVEKARRQAEADVDRRLGDLDAGQLQKWRQEITAEYEARRMKRYLTDTAMRSALRVRGAKEWGINLNGTNGRT